MGDKMHSVEGTPEPLFLASARSFDAGGLWPGNNRGAGGAGAPPGLAERPQKEKEKAKGGQDTLTWAACGLGGREPPRDEPRDPKRKKEKPREVKIL